VLAFKNVNRLKEWKHPLMLSAIQSVYVLLPAGRLVGSGTMVRPWPTNQSPECDIERIEFLHLCNVWLLGLYKK
uniref:hypothetical protein n=1 Tax=Klebsiella pneumoniae TaxID=573 RepID=UPI0022B9D54C